MSHHVINPSPDQVRAVLREIWDPIGVADMAGPRDEYDAYIDGIRQLLINGATVPDLTAHLVGIEQDQMGLRPDPAIARRAGEALLALNSRR